MTDITSTHNERVKLVKALQSRARSRREEGLIVLEGVRLVADALRCGARPAFAFYLPDQVAPGRPAADLYQALGAARIPLLSVTEAIMREVSDTETPQGILAVVPMPDLPLPPDPGLVLVLDGLNIPGNLGTALRTAAAAGVEAVILPPNTVDPFNPKALRGGMGAHFRLPIRQMGWPEIAGQFGGLAAYVATADGATAYFDVDWRRPSLLIVGGEAHGPTGDAYALGATGIAVPMVPGTESLNASVAAGVILYEARRQRLLAARKGA